MPKCSSQFKYICSMMAHDPSMANGVQVIPGGSEEFNAFIEHSMETDRPDVFLGILQSGFILGATAPSGGVLFQHGCVHVLFAQLHRGRTIQLRCL